MNDSAASEILGYHIYVGYGLGSDKHEKNYKQVVRDNPLNSLIHRVHVCGFVGLPSSCVKIYLFSCQRSPFFIREGQYMPDLSEIYYGSRNYYKGTGRTAYRQTGASSPERELLSKERFERRYKAANKRLSRDGKIALLVKYLDYSQSLAEWMVDADPERDYSSLLELERVK